VQARPDFGYDAEVPAPAPEGPEQVRLAARIGRHEAAIGDDDLGREQVVDTESDHADEGSVPAAENQPGESD